MIGFVIVAVSFGILLISAYMCRRSVKRLRKRIAGFRDDVEAAKSEIRESIQSIKHKCE